MKRVEDIKDRLRFEGNQLVYQYPYACIRFTGGDRPVAEVEWQADRFVDLDYPVMMFAEELLGDINFLDDPVDILPDGSVLMGNGSTVAPERLDEETLERAQDKAVLCAFQRTVPEAIRKRLMTIYDSRWKLYELFAYIPDALKLFDKNPALALLLANAELWRPERGEELRDAIQEQFELSKQDQVVHVRLVKWLGVDRSRRLTGMLRKFQPENLSFNKLKSIIDLQENEELFQWLIYNRKKEDSLLDVLVERKNWPYLTRHLLISYSSGGYGLSSKLSSLRRHIKFLGWEGCVDPIGGQRSLERTLKAMQYQLKDWLLNVQAPVPPPANERVLVLESAQVARSLFGVHHWMPDSLYGRGWVAYEHPESGAVLVAERVGVYSTNWKLANRGFHCGAYLPEKQLEDLWAELSGRGGVDVGE